MVPRISRLFRSQLAGLLAAIPIIFTACSPTAKTAATPSITSSPTNPGYLTPYQPQPTRGDSTPAPISNSLPTATPQPPPTVAPRMHVVKKGEDMGGIAWQYRVSLEALIAANPTVQPNMMSVGTELVIPPSTTPLPAGDIAAGDAAGPEASPPTPTPVSVEQGKLSCSRVEDGGMWCFMAVRNTQTYALEGLSAVFRLADQQTALSQMAYLPLDRLEPGTSLPLAAYFPPEQIATLTSPYQESSEFQSALPSANDGRYIPIHIENKKVLLSENGLSAILTADIVLDGPGEAKRVWVAAVAYDATGNVVGVRRWEKQDPHPWENGLALPMTMHVYSAAEKIDRVDLLAEARP